MRGHLILIEGLDRSGKSTQVERLHTAIPNSSTQKFPDRSTRIGAIINQYLTDESFVLPDQSIHLLFSANRWELIDSMSRALQSGTTVILDRYIYSGIAYSLAKSHFNHSDNQMASVEWLYSPDKGLLKPDLTLFLTLNMDEIDTRADFGDERYEKRAFQEVVKDNFLRLLDPKVDSSIHFIDVNRQSIDEVGRTIWDVVEGGSFHQLTDQPLQFFS
ncbi:Thymidylate kinase [Yamadazyma tenuis]|uniref:Thymidylate kinase n=1 Tax=Candida tenuis (strain ATCC 10573 / BCRC 21748 / CBS 615 / JCM 9827 / NBRC 10315 / NRRL Y-1498 / VKM Y-70) TaxID=590646 RepID=G3B8F2_CANTC|nr:P-loop containing nucleoside triphosphate hydrolase protein [Yamadazyma tenuis ATCC 10573]EGV62384.1 P-loop containing nucleoside triphosphate hydrolase protein [Yamadazyma tenuis ATCC 10573]WEJ93649.1 Thymidylate kinase [Yamadazyma tenuis]